MTDELQNSKGADGSIEDRLARLGKASVDTSSLECRLEALPPNSGGPAPAPDGMGWVFRMGAASMLLVAGVVFVAILMRPAGARILTSEQIIAIHEHYRQHEGSLLSVATVADANDMLARQWQEAPRLPEVEQVKIVGCCLHDLSDCRVACLHIKSGAGSAVTVIVGHSRDIRQPVKAKHESDGTGFSISQVGNHHVMTTRAETRFVALVSDIPLADLRKIALGLKLR